MNILLGIERPQVRASPVDDPVKTVGVHDRLGESRHRDGLPTHQPQDRQPDRHDERNPGLSPPDARHGAVRVHALPGYLFHVLIHHQNWK